jgi:hypothetical protein
MRPQAGVGKLKHAPPKAFEGAWRDLIHFRGAVAESRLPFCVRPLLDWKGSIMHEIIPNSGGRLHVE